MRSRDIARLFNTVGVGTKIDVVNKGLRGAIAQVTLETQARGQRLADKQVRGSRLAIN
jgi:hypothetical protein